MTGALKPFLARSAGLHAAMMVAAAFYVPGALKRADKVYMIDFVGGPAVIQSAGPAAGPADSEPQRPTQQAEKDSFATKNRRGVALPRPSLLQGWTDKKTPPKAETSAAPEAAASSGEAGAGVTTDLPNFPYPWYISQVRQMLWAAWQKRRTSLSGEGLVMFSIMRNGTFTDLRMESSSGDADFDNAAIESVQAAAPFPALPSDFGEPFLKIHLTLKSEALSR